MGQGAKLEPDYITLCPSLLPHVQRKNLGRLSCILKVLSSLRQLSAGIRLDDQCVKLKSLFSEPTKHAKRDPAGNNSDLIAKKPEA